MPKRIDFPVSAESIEAAKLARDAERAAAGIVCDEHGRIVFDIEGDRHGLGSTRQGSQRKSEGGSVEGRASNRQRSRAVATHTAEVARQGGRESGEAPAHLQRRWTPRACGLR